MRSLRGREAEEEDDCRKMSKNPSLSCLGVWLGKDFLGEAAGHFSRSGLKRCFSCNFSKFS